ncbi:MAG: hypothetical protein ACOYYS_18585 [Chloroflexota bacterium]
MIFVNSTVALSVLAYGTLTPSPSALGRLSPPIPLRGYIKSSESAVSPVAYVIPAETQFLNVRFNEVVRLQSQTPCSLQHSVWVGG